MPTQVARAPAWACPEATNRACKARRTARSGRKRSTGARHACVPRKGPRLRQECSRGAARAVTGQKEGPGRAGGGREPHENCPGLIQLVASLHPRVAVTEVDPLAAPETQWSATHDDEMGLVGLRLKLRAQGTRRARDSHRTAFSEHDRQESVPASQMGPVAGEARILAAHKNARARRAECSGRAGRTRAAAGRCECAGQAGRAHVRPLPHASRKGPCLTGATVRFRAGATGRSVGACLARNTHVSKAAHCCPIRPRRTGSATAAPSSCLEATRPAGLTTHTSCETPVRPREALQACCLPTTR